VGGEQKGKKKEKKKGGIGLGKISYSGKLVSK